MTFGKGFFKVFYTSFIVILVIAILLFVYVRQNYEFWLGNDDSTEQIHITYGIPPSKYIILKQNLFDGKVGYDLYQNKLGRKIELGLTGGFYTLQDYPNMNGYDLNNPETVLTFYQDNSYTKKVFYFKPAVQELVPVERDCKNYPPFMEYQEYKDNELGFSIKYPKGMEIDKHGVLDQSRYTIVEFKGLQRWCDPILSRATFEVEKGPYFSHAGFGRAVENEQDIIDFFESQTDEGVIEKIRLSNGVNLIVGQGWPGSLGGYVGWVIPKKGVLYRIWFGESEGKYEVARPIFQSFHLIDK